MDVQTLAMNQKPIDSVEQKDNFRFNLFNIVSEHTKTNPMALTYLDKIKHYE